jgi:hypothetical protein
MSHKRPATKAEMLVIGMIAAGAGIFFMLVGLGVVPVPKKSLHAPLWVVFCAGVPFFLGGGALLMHLAAGGKPDERDLPRNAPYWMRVAQYLAMLTIFAAFAVIGSWIAFGPGERAISMSMPFYSGPADELIGRTAFGIGAVITWLCTITVAVSGAKKLRRG